MGCCGDEEAQLKKDVHFVRSRDRSCTDIFFFLLFICAFAASGILIWRAHNDGGDPYNATHGQDFRGQTCSTESGAKFAAWPIIPFVDPTSNVTTAQAEYYFNIKVCVSSCDDTNDPANPWFKEPYESWKLWRFCIPKQTATTIFNYANQPSFHNAADEVMQLFSDLYTTWWIILASVGVAVLVGFIYAKMMSLRFFRDVLVWGVILSVLGACSVISWLLYDWQKTVVTSPLDTIDRKKTGEVLCYIMIGFTVLLFLIVIVLRKRINYALRIIGSASSALSQMRSTFLYPIVPIIFSAIYFAYWIWSALYLFTVVDYTHHPLPAEYDTIPNFAALTDKTFALKHWRDDYKYFFVFHFFKLLWVSQFFVYAAYMTIAGSLGQWFFARPDGASKHDKERGGDDDQLPYFPLTRSALRIIRFHIGTVAFASLIIAIFRFIRAVITYIQTKTKGKDNRLIRCILCCVKCLLRCIQKCLDYVSRNALVLTALNGDNFCGSACTAFGLLTSNILRVAAFNIISTFVLFIGRLFIAILTTMGGAIFIIRYYRGPREDEINSPILPIIVIFILSWFVGAVFIKIYEVTMECMMILSLSDKEGKYISDKIHKTFQMADERQKKVNDLEERREAMEEEQRRLHREIYEGDRGKKSKKSKKDKTPVNTAANNSSADLTNPYARGQ